MWLLMPTKYKVLVCGRSDTGLVRQNNEDVWDGVPEFRFFVLADGMGGHQAGEVAAKEAVIATCRLMRKVWSKHSILSLDDTRHAVQNAIEQANQFVYRLSRTDEQWRGMGTTLCCVQFHDNGVVYGHVGDSRIYRMRSKQLEQLTHDHSLMRELVELGQLQETQTPGFVYKNILTRAIGTEASVEPSVGSCDVRANDIYLMCSDGLTDMLSQDEIEEILKRSPTITEAAKLLISTANKKGGTDNVTVVLMKVQSIEK